MKPKQQVLSNIDEILSTINQTAKHNETANIISNSSIIQDKRHKQGNGNSTQILSVEALQLLNDLPDLSFMRTKGLMFPVKEHSTRH